MTLGWKCLNVCKESDTQPVIKQLNLLLIDYKAPCSVLVKEPKQNCPVFRKQRDNEFTHLSWNFMWAQILDSKDTFLLKKPLEKDITTQKGPSI